MLLAFKNLTVWEPSMCPGSNKGVDRDHFVTLKLYGNDFRIQIACLGDMSRHVLFAGFLVLLACFLACFFAWNLIASLRAFLLASFLAWRLASLLARHRKLQVGGKRKEERRNGTYQHASIFATLLAHWSNRRLRKWFNVHLAFIKGVTIAKLPGPLQYIFYIRPKSATIV